MIEFEIVIMAIVYSLAFYLNKHKKSEEFDPWKFLRTVIIGLIVGVLSPMLGYKVSFANINDLWSIQLWGSMTPVIIADQIIIYIQKFIKEYR